MCRSTGMDMATIAALPLWIRAARVRAAAAARAVSPCLFNDHLIERDELIYLTICAPERRGAHVRHGTVREARRGRAVRGCFEREG